MNSPAMLAAKGLLKLLVVGMLIVSFREMALRPSSGEPEATLAASSTAEMTPAGSVAGDGSAPVPPPQPLVATGPTDEDPEETESIQEEFQAVTDATLEMGVEEMAAYNRLVRWVANQPAELMLRRARKSPSYADFMHFPDKQRGKLVSLNLTLFRVRDAGKNEEGTQLYEAFGPTQESGSWLYWTVALDLPPKMPTGPKIYEKVTFVGYFFKLQGYEPGDAKPNAKPLKMPLLVGRLVWHPTQPVRVSSNDWYWVMIGGGGLLLIMVLQFGIGFLRKRRPGTSPLSTASVAREGRMPVDDWLAGTEQVAGGELTDSPGGNNSKPQDELSKGGG